MGEKSAGVRAVVEEEELRFDDGFEVEEDGPTRLGVRPRYKL